MTAWDFDVAVSTYALVKAGVGIADWRRVTVASGSYLDASLTALQMACVDGAIPTDILWRY